jgi:caa(3)-type oxidase subunit IV
MNNPPDISPSEHETEAYAHDVSKHVKTYVFIGLALLGCTALTVGLSYVDFGSRKGNIAVAMLLAAFKAGMVGWVFMHLAAEKKTIYRILLFTTLFVLGLFWLTYLAWYNPIVH